MTEIFISYAREDRPFVQELHEALERRERKTWIDWQGILPSAEWRKEIFGAIEAANAVVLIISPHSAASKICSDEVSHAVKNGKRIIPVLRADVEEEAALPNAVRERQWIFFRESDDFGLSLAALISAIDTDLDWVRAHTRLLTRAVEWEKHKRDYGFALHGSDLRRAESLLKSKEGQEPPLLPLQIEYILGSRRAANKRYNIAIGAAALALVVIVFIGALFWQKRRESALNLAANFREMGISELANNNPLAAEVFLARALSISNNLGARERLLEARAKSPRLMWVSPQESGSTLLGVSWDGALFATSNGPDVSIWSVQERRKLRVFRTRINAQGSPFAAFGRDHDLLAIGAANKIEIWDLQSSSEQPIRVLTSPNDISNLNLSRDGTTVIAGSDAGVILLWDIRNQPGPPAELRGHSDKIAGTAFMWDGRGLVSGSWDESVKVWNLEERSEETTFTGHDDALLCVAISPNGELVASAGWDDAIWIWDRSRAKKVRALPGHKGSILTLAFSPDGKWLASGSEDRTAKLWDVEKGKHVLTLPGDMADVTSVTFIPSRGDYQLLTGYATGVVRLWDISKIGQRDELITLRGHSGGVTMIAFDPTGSLVASSSVDKSVAIWDLKTNRLVRTLDDQRNNVSAVAFNPDGRHVASANKSSEVRVWDINSGKFRAFEDGADEKIRHVAFSHDGKLLIGGSENGKIRIWNVANGTVIHSFIAHAAKIQGLEFSPDGTLLASSSEDGSVKLWRVADWSLHRPINGHRSGVYEIAFSPDGRFIFTGSDDKTARLWSIDSGKEIMKPIEHESPVWAVDFGLDGKTIVTGSQDSTIQLWKLMINGDTATIQDRIVLRISDGPVWWMKFHKSGGTVNLGIGGQDRAVRVFRMDRFDALFSNPAKLEVEAGEQGGLMVGEKPSGEPQIVAISQERISSEVTDPSLQAAVKTFLK
jgi:WD40 repeat protein